MIEREPDEARALPLFVARLGAAMNAAGEPAYSVQERLMSVARAYDRRSPQVTAFPTFLMVTMGDGEPVTLELTSVAYVPHLDQISALDRLVRDAEHGVMSPTEGLERLEGIERMSPRFGRWQSVIGYAVFTAGLCMILQPAPRDIAAAAVLGALVGLIRSFAERERALTMLMPLVAAFIVAALSALAVKHHFEGPGLRSIVASLVVFLPGAALTTAVLELAAGQLVSGAARLVSGIVQLGFLAFGIVAGIGAVGVASTLVLTENTKQLGAWAPWLGVFVLAVGVMVWNSAPPRSFFWLLVVLYSAWCGQLLGSAVFGAYVSAFVGALVMTIVSVWVARFPSAMPQHASFLPGFWLLVPGAFGLIGLTELASPGGSPGTDDLVATVTTIFAVAVGVLSATLLMSWASSTSPRRSA